MRHTFTILLALIFTLVVGTVHAGELALDLLDTATPYTADFTISSSRGVYHGKVWHSRGRERREVVTSGGGQAVLLLRDSDAAYVMGLANKWYVGLSLRAAGALASGLDSWQATRVKVRDETVGGLKTTRWKTRAEGPKGGFDGDIWITRDGIVVKAVGVIENPNGDDSPVEMTLSGVKIGPVDRQMLDLPQGWFGFDLRKVPPERIEQAIEGIKPLLEGRKGG